MKAPEVVRQGGSTRVVTKTAAELFQEGLEKGNKYSGGKWGGLYLRAPEIYFRVLEKAGDRLVRLGDVAEVRFGIKTGANDFFYLEPLSDRPPCPLCGHTHEGALTAEEERAWRLKGAAPPEGTLVAVRNGMGWEGYLEYSVLKPVFASPTEASTLAVPLEGLGRVFLPPHGDMHSLPSHARAYVEHGEKTTVEVRRGQAKGHRVALPHLSTLAGRNPWWWLGEWQGTWIILPVFERTRKYAFWNTPQAAVDHALYLVYPRDGMDAKALFLVLNSSLFHFIKELLARPPEGGGGGPIQINVNQYEAMPVLDPRLLKGEKDRLWENLLSYRIPPYWEEVGLEPPDFANKPSPMPHRATLDGLMCEQLGLTEEERDEIWRQTARLIWQRVAMAAGEKA